jgi:ubiquinone/menaquinone biosynthesis C-methylase UbiE
MHDNIKREVIAQWSADPAGALAAGDDLGTPESFRRIEAYRYRVQPWMHQTFHFSLSRGQRVLEVGVGAGTDHVQFARAGADLTGIDLTPRSVELTRMRLEQEGFEPRVSVMDAEKLEFPDNSFDVVYSFGVLHHTSSAERAFCEVRRVLRPGGRFIGGLYNRHSFFIGRILLKRYLTREYRSEEWTDRLARIEYSTSNARPYVRLFTRSELERELREAGFSAIYITRRHLGLAQIVRRVPPVVERVAGRLGGWYLIHDARK